MSYPAHEGAGVVVGFMSYPSPENMTVRVRRFTSHETGTFMGEVREARGGMGHVGKGFAAVGHSSTSQTPTSAHHACILSMYSLMVGTSGPALRLRLCG